SAALGLLVMLGSVALWINGHGWAPITVVLGLLWVLFVLYHWFGDAISESEGAEEHHLGEDEPAHAPAIRLVDALAVHAAFRF
ncbi:hypothetical protein, partial [Bacillus cereus]|uniref:hypothetical protein n=1 Tax=Bacillus cereus TaxID=1396 RepID=UPI00345BC520